MDRWTFNTVLFSSLTSVLDISINEMAKRVHVGQQTLNRYIVGDNKLPVDVLIQMCNHLRMPSYFFVSENQRYDIPNREMATISADQWQPVVWDEMAVEHTFGDGGGRIFWKDVAVVMGVTAQKPHDRFLLRKRFTVVDFLKVCSHFDISPFLFLVDPNRKDKKDRRNAPARKTEGYDSLLTEINTMRLKIADLTSVVNDVTKEYKEMADRYDNLLEAHKELLQRVNTHLKEGYAGLVAEPEAK